MNWVEGLFTGALVIGLGVVVLWPRAKASEIWECVATDASRPKLLRFDRLAEDTEVEDGFITFRDQLTGRPFALFSGQVSYLCTATGREVVEVR